MTNNIFENAYFGKTYKTRDGRKAIYISESKIDKGAILIVYENLIYTHKIMNNGHYWATPNVETDNDIVSEWQEEINEEELTLLAIKDINEMALKGKEVTATVLWKAGYRKAKEQ